jgi:outer membrane protein assembly factor BamD (BamD/ComL family)
LYRLNCLGNKILCLIVLTGILTGCSTKMNTPVSRAYHNLTAQYNIYFNAKQSLKAGLVRIDKTVPDDYTHFLPVYKTSNPDAAKAATAEMELAILKCSKLIALHSITKSPQRRSNTSEKYKKFASKGEYNNWVDDSYVLMGQASYYSHDYHRANENFNYVIRNFTDNPNRYVAYLWMAKTYIETGENDKALEIFKLLERDGGFPKGAKKDLNIAQAHYYMKNNQFDEAISHLKTALQSNFPRNEKLRYNYILAQLLAATDKPEEAVKQYKRVLRMKPPFQMAFNARISALEQAGGNDKETKKQLTKLLEDQNNLEYRDRIYFAIGQIALKENRKSDAEESFRLSVMNSSTNNNQRALSGLTLARMLFEEENYLLAAAYYDSVVAVINNNYPGYQEIMTRSASLRRLAVNLNTIQREDSLQKLAMMPEAQRNALINGIISKIQQEEAAKLAQANIEKSDQNYFRSQQYRPQIRVADNQNLWYFYNPTTVGIGKSEFQRIWGKRSLEDNWRRKNKVSVSAEETGQLTEAVNEAATPDIKKKAADPKTMEYYLQNVPLTDSLKKVSTELIKSAFFNAGRIYQTDFNNPQKAIETFEELNRRYPGSIFELPAWFELYQLNNLNNKQQADLYKDKVIKKYPDSKYAKYLLNPGYFAELETNNANVEKKYAETFRFYKAFDYNNAKRMAGETLALKPDSNLVPKARFIEVVSEGSSQDKAVFTASLDRYISAYPKAPTKEFAVQIRDLLKTNSLNDFQQLVAKGYINENIINSELKPSEKKITDEFDGKFSYDENMFHYYVIAFSQETQVDMNRLIYDIANYNLDYYTSTDFDIESVNLNPKTRMVVVRSMPDKEEGLIYFRSIIRKRPVFQALKGIEYVNFVASSSNYRKVIEEKDYLDYLRFFTKNYSPYISSQIPSDDLPPPMELIAKARKEEEPTERGKFILLKPDISREIPKDAYFFNNNDVHSFVISVKDSTFQMAPTIAKVLNYNYTETGGLKTEVKTETIGGRKMLIVSGLQNSDAAMAYFRKIIQDRALFSDLENEDYLNFIISLNNIEVLKKKKDVQEYLSFFGENYLGNKPKVTPAPLIAPAVSPSSSLADYTGPYNSIPGKDNIFVLVFQPAEIEGAKLISSFNAFDAANFGSPAIKVAVEKLDDFRSILLVTGLGEQSSALVYYRKAIADPILIASLKNVNYRNFIISAENLQIFKKEKNIIQYMDFFNRIK